MKWLKLFTLFLLSSAIFAQDGSVSLKINKENGSIDVVKDGQVVTASFSVKAVELDIFSPEGEYAGSLELQELVYPSGELAQGETIAVKRMVLLDKGTNAEIEVKGLKIDGQ